MPICLDVTRTTDPGTSVAAEDSELRKISRAGSFREQAVRLYEIAAGTAAATVTTLCHIKMSLRLQVKRSPEPIN